MYLLDSSVDPSRSPKALPPSQASLLSLAGTVVLFVAGLWALSNPLAALAALVAVVLAGFAAVAVYHLGYDAGARDAGGSGRRSRESGHRSRGPECPETAARAN